MPRGAKVNPEYHTYYRNSKGIYYISVEHVGSLITHGEWGYLQGCDPETFVVLNHKWSKDKNHVWYGLDLLNGTDAPTFNIDYGGLPKDKYNVYVYDADRHAYRPPTSGIDLESAEHFVDKQNGQGYNWMRDNRYVYFYDIRQDVDRNTFAPLGNTNWWTDKDYIYNDSWDSTLKRGILTKVDTLQSPVKTLGPGRYYLRNGRNIIYMNQVIVEDIDVERFEAVGGIRCIVNDMLFRGKEWVLEGQLNVREAKFYFYGRIAVDRHYVFFDEKPLNDIDAPTFRQINDRTFEDKNYIYTVKDRLDDGYPFMRKKK